MVRVIAVMTLLPEECSVADLPTKRVPMTKAMASRAFFIVFVYERFKTNCIVRRESKAAKCETVSIHRDVLQHATSRTKPAGEQ
jgi:hypothetical protein